MFFLVQGEGNNDYFVNMDHVSCISKEGEEWSYTINNSRVPITNECAQRLLGDLAIKELLVEE